MFIRGKKGAVILLLSVVCMLCLGFSIGFGLQKAGIAETSEPAGFAYEEWADECKPKEFAMLDFADSAQFVYPSGCTKVGNTLSITGVNNNVSVIKTVGTYSAYRTSFRLETPDKIDRYSYSFEFFAASGNGLGMPGYFMLLDGSTNTVEVRKTASSSNSHNFGGMKYTYGSGHLFEIEAYTCLLADSRVKTVINIAIDGTPLHYQDVSTDASNTASSMQNAGKPQKVYSDAQQFRFRIRNAGKKATIVSDLCESNVSATFAGEKKSLYENMEGSSVELTGEDNIEFGTSARLHSKEKLGSFSSETDIRLPSEFSGIGTAVAFRYDTETPKTDGFSPDRGYLAEVSGTELSVTSQSGTVRASHRVDPSKFHKLMISAVNVEKTAAGESGVYVSVRYGEALIQFFDRADAFAADGYLQIEAAEGSEIRTKMKVLFLGNSITQHASIEGWPFSHGMAVPKAEMDYVHLLMEKIRSIDAYSNAEYRLANVAAWEKDYATYNYYDNYTDLKDLNPDLVIVRVGENAASNTDDYLRQYRFSTHLGKLIDFVKGGKDPDVVLSTSFWGSGSKNSDTLVDAEITALARERNNPLVRLGDLGSTGADKNCAFADREIYEALEGTVGGKTYAEIYDGFSADILRHPGVTGMKNIADRLWKSVESLLTGGDGMVSIFFEDEETGIRAEGEKGVLSSFGVREIPDGDAAFIGAPAVDGQMLYRLYEFGRTGNYYNLFLPLKTQDVKFTLTLFEIKGGKAEILDSGDYEISSATTVYPCITISAQIDGLLGIYLDFDLDMIYSAGGSTARLESVPNADRIRFASRHSEFLEFDLTGFERVNALILDPDVFSPVLSEGKNVRIRFGSDRGFEIERMTFEVLSMRNVPLYFAIVDASANQKTHAGTALGEAGASVVGENVFNVGIRENGAAGTPLVIAQGVKVTIPVDLGTAGSHLFLYSADLPQLASSKPSNVVNEGKRISVSDGVCSFDIVDFGKSYIVASAAEERIEIVSNPTKTSYRKGESLDLSGMVVELVLGNGVREALEVRSDMISGFDAQTSGTQTVKIVFGSLETSFEVTVEDEPSGGCKGCGGGSAGVGIVALLALSVVGKRNR